MSSTLIMDPVRSAFTEPLINKFSVLLGEPEPQIQKAVHGATAMIWTDILYKGWYQEHYTKVWNLAKRAAASDFHGHLHEMAADSGGLVTGSVLLNQGTDFATALLGARTEPVVNEISRYAGISIRAASFITGIVSFAALDTIGRHILNTNMDANGMARWLKTETEGHTHAVPAGLEVKRALNIQYYPWEKKVMARSNMALVVVLVVVVVGAILFFLVRSRQQELAAAGTATPVVTDTTARATATTTSNVDTATASTVQVSLPNGNVLDAQKGGTEDRLVSFLSNPQAKLDKDHGNWFDFTQVNFASNSSALLLASDKQLRNIVMILGAFPKAKIKIGGYSDNTGDSVDNVRLSHQRAENIDTKLKELGAKPAQITGAQGYGPQYAVGDNGTADGRAMNRRMSIDVKSK